MTDRILVANRGEIAARILRAADDLRLETVAVYAGDDDRAAYLSAATARVALSGSGPRAYLDVDDLIRAGHESGATMIHPGYGFLSESARFAARCMAEGFTFIGPRPQVLDLFGDKARGRAFAASCGVPLVAGSNRAVSLAAAQSFFAGLSAGSAMMIKAAAGGGGRGIRIVSDAGLVETAYLHCQSEAAAAFGDGAVYVEQVVPTARHVEVQLVGDGTGEVITLGERECTLQRRRQKLVEICPSPWLSAALRAALLDSAVRIGRNCQFLGLGTVEFLVSPALPEGYAFIETNARLQVEHTVTEEAFGFDLVQAQIALAQGASLGNLGLAGPAPSPRGYAIQARVNAETLLPDGTTSPAHGVLDAFQVPTGPGVRVDTAAYPGWTVTVSYDSLLAKVVTFAAGTEFAAALRRAQRALADFRVTGVATNLPLLRVLLNDLRVAAGAVDTGFVERNIRELAPALDTDGPGGGPEPDVEPGALIGRVRGVVVSIVEPGTAVRAGQEVAVVEAMKMEHVVVAPIDGVVVQARRAPGDTVSERDVLLILDAAAGGRDVGAASDDEADDAAVTEARLAEVRDRHRELTDKYRAGPVARRHQSGHWTVREKIDRLCVPGTFVEYGGLIVAGQRQRHTLETLRERSPADGVVTGVGEVALEVGVPGTTTCVFIGYDYTVLAGTQGHQGHRKVVRMLALARQQRLPVILFAEGGGGRAGETDGLNAFGLDITTWRDFARLSGLIPVVGIVAGRCFAGNAALLGCCDVVIATRDSALGMGGPAMIEGAGLGVVAADDIGPAAEQATLGVVDVLVETDDQAVEAGRGYLSLLAHRSAKWEAHDQTLLRTAIPASPRRSYDVRRVVELICDVRSTLELRREFGRAMLTALGRVEGRTIGIVANDPAHLAGAVDSTAADKAARFIQLCDAFDIPVLLLCDTPGIVVGPAAERGATVRHSARLFLATANATVPMCTIVTRRAFGLGAQAMVAGSVHAPVFTVAWPGAQFGSMGVTGMVNLGYRKELDQIADPAQRKAFFDQKVAEAYERGKAIVAATHLELDDVIDPALSRQWIVTGLFSSPARPPSRDREKRMYIDAW